MISAFPLTWPEGWKRTDSWRRKAGRFNSYGRAVSISEGVERVFAELEKLNITRNDLVISTNVKSRLDGFPRSDQPKPADPGVAVYWETKKGNKVMAIDRYTEVADNLAAIAATLDAMRAIERHGGAEILDRAFTGFTALPNPDKARTWRDVLGYQPHDNPAASDVKARYRVLAQSRHPDRGGSEAAMSEINQALAAAEKEVR